MTLPGSGRIRTARLCCAALLLTACGGSAEIEIRGSGSRATPTRDVPASPTSPPAATPTSTTGGAPTSTPTLTHTRTPSATLSPTTVATFATPTASQTEGMPPTATSVATSTRVPTSPASPSPTTTSASATNTPTPTPTPTLTASPVVATSTATATLPPTVASTSTPTPTSTPGGGNPRCGNGFLDGTENYDDPNVGLVGDPDGTPCPEDATVLACEATATRAAFAVNFSFPTGAAPTSATVLLSYRGDLVSLPGSGLAISVRQRVTTPPPPPFVLSPNDLDYALRLVLSRTSPLTPGLLFSVSFDTCAGASLPGADQFGCFVEGCAGAGGPVNNCTCSVSAAG